MGTIATVGTVGTIGMVGAEVDEDEPSFSNLASHLKKLCVQLCSKCLDFSSLHLFRHGLNAFDFRRFHDVVRNRVYQLAHVLLDRLRGYPERHSNVAMAQVGLNILRVSMSLGIGSERPAQSETLDAALVFEPARAARTR